jgi:hypothetical protein
MSIQFILPGARAFDTDTRPERFEMFNIRFTPIPALKWCLVSGGVNKPIVKIHRVEEGSQPELSQESGAI